MNLTFTLLISFRKKIKRLLVLNLKNSEQYEEKRQGQMDIGMCQETFTQTL